MRNQQTATWFLDLCILAGICLALLIPAVFLGAPVFVNDAVHDDIPELAGLARDWQTGVPRLWNHHLFAGGRPAVYQPNLLYYPLWHPFLIIANINNPASFARTALLLPYLLHMILAAAGTYVFVRHTLASGRTGALTAGILYALSPAFSTAIEGANQAALMAWLPWLAISGTAFLRSGGALQWGTTLMVLAIINSTGVMHLLVRLYAFTPALFFLVWLQDKQNICRTQSIGRLAALAAAYVLAAGMLSQMWMGIYEARASIESAVADMQTSALSITKNFEAEGHTPVLHFASLFCPDLFGVISLHGWGVAINHPVTQLGHAGGGIVMMSVIIYGLIRLLRGESCATPGAKCWARAAAVGCVFLIILMMGKHTVFYKPLAGLGGFLISGPHPYYYQFGVCWLLAVLAGLGINELSAIHRHGQKLLFAGIAACCGVAAIAAAVLSLLSPVNIEMLGTETASLARELSFRHTRLLWYHAMRNTGGISWLLSGPGLYILISVAGCWTALRLCPGRRLGALALIVISLEYTMLAGTVLYESTNIWQSELNFSDRGNKLTKLRHAGELNYFEKAQELSVIAEAHQCRWTMMWSRGDNMAQYFGSRALLGHASRPLIKAFYEAAEQVYEGFPYQLKMKSGDDQALTLFLENHNVGFLLCYSAERVIRFNPVPAVYRQTVVKRMIEADQRKAVISQPFRDACFVLPESRFEWIQPDESHGGEKKPIEPVEWARPHSDRIELHSRGSTAAMIVITECFHPGWQAEMNGQSAKVYRVNHHQMAVEIPPGDHHVSLQFKPRSFTLGLRMSLVSSIIAMSMCGGLALTNRKSAKAT